MFGFNAFTIGAFTVDLVAVVIPGIAGDDLMIWAYSATF